MRITVLINHDAAALLALSYLQAALAEHEVCVFYTQLDKKPNLPTKLVELGKFDAEIMPQAESIVRAFKFEKMNDINGADFDRYRDSTPDLVISIRHMRILQDAAINLPKYGVINLHSGPLPAYQGVMATFWALNNREEYLGTTLHYIENAAIDRGAIIARSQTPANYDQSYLWNVFNIYSAGCANIIKTLDRLNQAEPLNAQAQPASGTYFSFPDQAALTAFQLPLFNANDSLNTFLASVGH